MTETIPLLYRALCEHCMITDACIINGNRLIIDTNRTDIARNVRRKLTHQFRISYNVDNGYVCERVGFPVIDDDLVATVPAPDGTYILLIHKASPKQKGENTTASCYTLDVIRVSDGALVCSAATETHHGKIYTGGILGSVQWSHDGKRVLYMAEAKAAKHRELQWTKASTGDDNDDDDEKKNGVRGTKYDHTDHLGEQLSTSIRPLPFELDVHTTTIRQYGEIPDELVIGQAQWWGDGGIIVVGWKRTPRALGLLHYNTRASALYTVTEKQFTKLTNDDDDYSPMCPRLYQNQLIYVSTDRERYHASGVRMRIRNMDTGKSRTLVDIEYDSGLGPRDFPGLWLSSGGIGILHRHVWISDETLLVSSLWRSQSVLVFVSLYDQPIIKRVRPPPNHASLSSMTVLDVCSRSSRALVVVSCINQPPVVYWMRIIAHDTLSVQYTRVWQPIIPTEAAAQMIVPSSHPLDAHAYNMMQGMIADGSVQLDVVYPRSEYGAGQSFEGLLISPTTTAAASTNRPLIVYPHGGPHSAFSTAWSYNVLFLVASTGASVLLVNYRGSLGFGQHALTSLPGKCGQQDVEDVMELMNVVLSSGVYNAKAVCVLGGSHGGFLVTHLIGQYPDAFVAACTRNPVTNMAYMCGATDIPDWCYIESGQEFTERQYPTVEMYEKMFNASPIRHIHRVNTPVLMMLGDADRRVPYHQGMEYHRLLSANGQCVSRLLVYPENQHSLNDSVATEADSSVQAALWFMRFLP